MIKKYTLRSDHPPFEVVDGPLAGRRYERGQTYTEIPMELVGRFTIVPEAKADLGSDKKKPPLSAGVTTKESTDAIT